MASERFLEDFTVGASFASAPYEITAEEIIAFARRYDPQPFHLDPAAAAASIFGRHVASGWHTAAVTMRLIVDSDLCPAGGVVGAGVESLQWPVSVAAGDTVHVEIEVLDVRASRSKPGRGIVKYRIQTLNAAGVAVQVLVVNTLVPSRIEPAKNELRP